MIYYFQRIWLFLTYPASSVVRSKKDEELRAFREYHRARWAYAGKGLLNHITVYLRYNRTFGHVVLCVYACVFMLLGAAISLLTLLLLKKIGG